MEEGNELIMSNQQYFLTIKGIKWKYYKLSTLEYNNVHGDDSVGVTLKGSRIMVFKDTDKKTIIHELTHAYVSSCCIDSCDLDAENLEEIFAEINSYHIDQIKDQSEEMYKCLNKKE